MYWLRPMKQLLKVETTRELPRNAALNAWNWSILFQRRNSRALRLLRLRIAVSFEESIQRSVWETLIRSRWNWRRLILKGGRGAEIAYPSISEMQSAKGKPAHVQCWSEQVGYKSLNSKCNETKITYIEALLLCNWILMDMIDMLKWRGNPVRTSWFKYINYIIVVQCVLFISMNMSRAYMNNYAQYIILHTRIRIQ